MQTYYKICILLVIVIPVISCLEDGDEERNQKLISSFQIVRFPNDACKGSGTRNGTCYTSQECSDKKGTSAGSCADGFGVCCTFEIKNCGSTTSENSTAWTTPTTLPTTASTCDLKVCPSGPEICSIRLDFTTFVITGPNTVTTGTVRRRLGTPVGDIMDKEYQASGSSYATNCMLDVFTTTSASASTNPPAICGTLSAGDHMYVEADTDRCNLLEFSLGPTVGTLPALTKTNSRGVTSVATRAWDITVSLIECTSETLPPPGCTKYYWGGAARLTTYNFASDTTHLASQHERFCLRKERGNCVGCFSAAAVANFQLSGLATDAKHYTAGCCGYHTMLSGGELGITATTGAVADGIAAAANSSQMGFDCIIIPGAFVHVSAAIGTVSANPTTANLQMTSLSGATGNLPAPPQICGSNGGIGVGAANVQAAAGGTMLAAHTFPRDGVAGTFSICTRNAPFTLEFMSDDLDGLGYKVTSESENTDNSGTGNSNRGFQLEHTQVACTT